MRKQTFKRFLLVFVLAAAGLLAIGSDSAEAANPQLINFQGKVVNSDGTNVANGNYDFDFILYDDPTAGTNRWQEGWTTSTSQITVTNGVFQANLGTYTALPNFNTYPNLYLAIRFNNDANGYMTPRVRLTSTPYALNADNLGGLSSGNFVQLAQGVQTDSSTANPSIYLNKTNATGTPNILQLQKSGSDVLVVNNSGDLIVGKAGTGGINGKLVFNTTNASNTTITLVAASTGTSYSLTLPTTGPSTSQCLQTDSVTASQLIFSSCGGGSSSLDDAYNQSANTGNTILLTAAGDGVIIQDAATTVGGNLFAVQKNGGSLSYLGVTTTGINIQSNFTGSAVNALAFDTSAATPHLRIYGSDGVKHADIYYDNATNTAFYGASTGTAVLGSGTGAVSIASGAGAGVDIDAANGILTLGSNTTTLQRAATSFSIDLTNASASTLTVTNSGAGVASLSVEGGVTTGANSTVASSSGTLTLQGGSGNVQIASSVLAGTGALAVQSAATTALTVTGNAASTWSTSAGNLTLQGGSALILDAASGSAITVGNTGSGNYAQFAATSRELSFSGSARHTRYIMLAAEFPGAVLTGDGANNTGTMTSDAETSSPFRTYYNWTSTGANDYDVWIKVPLPEDWSAWSGSGGTATGFGTAADEGVTIEFFGTNNTTICSSDIVTGVGWNTDIATCNYTGGTFATSGNFFTIRVKLAVTASGDNARIANIKMPYLSKW